MRTALPIESVWMLRTALAYQVLGFGLGAWALAFSAGAGRAALVASHAEMVLIGFAVQFALGVAWSSFPRSRGSRGDPRTIRSAYLLLNAGVIAMVAANLLASLPEDGAQSSSLAGKLIPSAANVAAVGGTLVLAGVVAAGAALWHRVRPV